MAAMIPFIPVAISVIGNIMGGQQQKAAADYQAAQLEQQAGQSRAAAQRDAIEQRRQAELVQSTLRANAGGGGSDPTNVRLAQDIAGEGEYRALTSLYGGEERARGMEMSASGARMEGKNAVTASLFRAGSSILGSEAGKAGIKSLYEKYGAGGPSAYDFKKSGYGGRY